MGRFTRAQGRRKSTSTEEEQTPSPNSGAKNRLSKPKVNGFANSSATLSRQTLNTTFDGCESVVESSTGDNRSKHATRQSLRSQLCGPEDREVENELNSDEPLGGFATNGKLSRSCSQATTHYLSAKGSMSQLTNASQISLIPESRTIDLEAAVAILQELRKTASPEDLVALRTYQNLII